MTFDPKTNREQREAERAANRPEDKPLDPPFPYERAYFDPFEFEITRDAARPEDDRELFANMLPDALALRKRITATDDLAGVKIRAANHVPQVALIPCNVG
jgi:hypothetical protein